MERKKLLISVQPGTWSKSCKHHPNFTEISNHMPLNPEIYFKQYTMVFNVFLIVKIYKQ